MNKHILIIDDDTLIKAVLRSLFAGRYKISEAENGADALSLIYNGGYFDLVLTDIQMPIMSGIELLEEMGKSGINIPVCVMSASLDKTVINKLQRLGCSDFFDKPFRMKKLLERIDTILAN